MSGHRLPSSAPTVGRPGPRKPHDPVACPCARALAGCLSPATYEVLITLEDGRRYAAPEVLCYVHATDQVAVMPRGASILLLRLDRRTDATSGGGRS